MVLPNPLDSNPENDYQLFIVIGINIISYEQYEHLQNFIKLFDDQPIKLYISLAYDKNILSNNFMGELYELVAVRDHKLLLQSKPLEQFEHYSQIIDELGTITNNKIWIMFIGDNNLWENNVISVYQSILEELSLDKYSNIISYRKNQMK